MRATSEGRSRAIANDTPQGGAAALVVAGVGHSFGPRVALDDVSLTVEAGRFTALLGVNGAGKTTLFNLITRLYACRSGRISVCGVDLAGDPGGALARLGVVFQSRSLDAALTVAQNIAYHGALRGIPRKEASARGIAALEKVGMADALDTRVATLSGGEARRAEIACALLHRPALLLCDEATVGLDVKARADIVEDAHRLAAEEGVGVLWATHLVDEVRAEDPVVVLHRGRVLKAARAADIAGPGGLSAAFLDLTGAEAA